MVDHAFEGNNGYQRQVSTASDMLKKRLAECRRLDAVDDLLAHPAFCSEFATLATKLPDIEVGMGFGEIYLEADIIQRLISRIHAGAIKQSDFLKVVEVCLQLSGGPDAQLTLPPVLGENPENHRLLDICGRKLQLAKRRRSSSLCTGFAPSHLAHRFAIHDAA